MVALRKESVDRNCGGASAKRLAAVALRKESVDRNACKIRPVAPDISSLSARRAWIEMHCVEEVSGDTWGSLSARRAWIEILTFGICVLKKESRSPQGERG